MFRIECLETRRLLASDWQNVHLPCDVDQSAVVSPRDALVVIEQLNREGTLVLPARHADSVEDYVDVSGDGRLAPLDALLVINALNRSRATMALVVGLSPESDRNGNGVVLAAVITVNGQTLAGNVIDIAKVGSNAPGMRVVADAEGRFAVNLSIEHGLHSWRMTAMDEIGRTLSQEIVVRRGDVIQDWNAASLNIIREWTTTSNDPYPGRIVSSQPPLVARNLAMIHTAMFDAINSIQPLYEPYLIHIDAPPGAIASIAAAAAAHRVASQLYNATDEQSVWDASLSEALATISSDVDIASSLELGRQVGDAVLAARANDGASSVVTYTTGNEPGDWNRTAPGYLPPLLPQWPQVKPFALQSGDQFRPAPPPALNSLEYASAVDQVVRLGGYISSERTSDQTEIALFWADGGGTFTPPGHWNIIASDVALARYSSLTDNARMFALLNIALADAGIASWDAKYAYNLWRPIDAIRQADTDGNVATVSDPNWIPLINTPPFPTYTSGHSTFSGAAATVLTSLFGEHVAFTSQMDGQNAASQRPLDPSLVRTRTFNSFEDAAAEAGLSRIYGGIHFDFDTVAGHATGNAVGRWTMQSVLKPIAI